MPISDYKAPNMKRFLSLILLLPAVLHAEIITLEYKHWTIDYNCEHRGYEFFHFKTVPDTGKLDRYKPFHQEQRLPEHCRQFSTDTYKTQVDGALAYDRGHAVSSNLWDHDKELMKSSNLFSNIVPQAKRLNRHGVWRQTEVNSECFREIGTVEVWGGVIWGKNESNDHFKASHGVTTPDLLWKVQRFPDGEINAFLMPNDYSPTKKTINDYLVTPHTLETLVGKYFESIPDTARYTKVLKAKERFDGCDIE